MNPSSLGLGGAALLLALAQAVAPRADEPPWQWAEGRIVIPAEANTSRPGPLSWDGFEYCLEPLERLDYANTASRVAIMAAGQTGKSNIGVVWVGWTICEAPRPMGLAVPSGPKAQSFNSKKLQPVIDKTPDLSARIVPQNSRDERASTTRQKNYPGGSLTIFSAGSVNDLQSESFGAIWMTETPNFLADVGGRGSPVTQVRVRMDGWESVGTKELHESTPGEEGACPVSADFEAGDQRLLYLPCPHCDRSFRIEWEDFVVPEDASEEPYVIPPCCGETDGAVITERQLPMMKRSIRMRVVAERAGQIDLGPDFAGGYLPTYPSKDPANPAPGASVAKAEFGRWRARSTEGRQPSYHFWQVVSPLKTWRGLAQDWRDAKGKPTEESAFRQQKLGKPTEAAIKAPGHLDLHSAAQIFGRRRGEIPPGTCWLSLQADIQGDSIEWSVMAHGPLLRARIDRGVIEKDPLEAAAWAELAKVIARRWEGPECRPIGPDVVGIDSGGVDGVTPRVYEFVRSRQNCYAIKGASRALTLPTDVKRIEGKDTRGKTIKVALLLVDTYIFKKFTAWALRNLVTSAKTTPEPMLIPGTVTYEDDATEEDFRQLTAEVFVRDVNAKVGDRGEWQKLRPNEQLDLDVYAQALAYQKGVTRWDQSRWAREFLARAREPGSSAEPPLLELAAQPEAPVVGTPRPGLIGNAATTSTPRKRRVARSGYMGG